MMSAKTVLIQKKDTICTLVLNRPEVMNAMNEALILELKDAVKQIAAEDDVRVVVLKGAGKNFCSGADMSRLAAVASSHQTLEAIRYMNQIITGLREIPQPVVTALRGVAYGAGANLALAGDFVVAADDAKFCEIFVHIGAVLDAGGTYFLPRLVGLAKARELALLGNEIDGKTAASIGLIYKSVPGEKLDDEVAALVGNLTSKPLAAMRLIKAGLNESFDKRLKDILDWEAAHQAIRIQTPELKEIVAGFLKSRGKD
jgi:2-(1,2-epoxy-1,2-dihydrophenyl)acetyl-CoA isomerase